MQGVKGGSVGVLRCWGVVLLELGHVVTVWVGIGE